MVGNLRKKERSVGVKSKIVFGPEQLRVGIRRDHRAPRNSLGFLNILNAMCHETGLREYEPVTTAVSSAQLSANSITLSFPFPVIHKGKGATYLFDSTEIYSLNESTGVLTQQTTYNMNAWDTAKAISSGLAWRIADFWDFVFATNGTSVVARWNKPVLEGGSAVWLSDTSPTVQCCCDYRGRLILGGFSATAFWGEKWEHFFEEMNRRRVKTFVPELLMKQNFIWYSSVGGGNALWLFMPDFFLDSFDDTDFQDADFIMHFLHRNDSGFVACPFSGNPIFVKQLGDHLMVYGEDGIVALTHQSQPVSTLGQIPIMNNGGASPFLRFGVEVAGGSEEKHLVIDDSGWLWVFTPDRFFVKAERIGYYEKFNSMIDNQCVISHDPINDRYYICDGTSTYLFSAGGLTKVDQIVNGIGVFDGIPKGCWVSTTGSTDDDFELESDVIDMQTRNLKTIYKVEIAHLEDTDTTETFKVAVSYKMDKTESFSTTDYVLTNPDGAAFITIQGIEFKIHLLSSKYNEQPPPDYIYIYYEVSDMRLEERVKVVNFGRE